MRTTLGWAPAALLTCGLASAQLAGPAPTLVSPELAAALDVGQATHQVLDLPAAVNGATELELFLGDEAVQLTVWPHSLRAANFQLLVQQADGSLVEVEPPPVATLRGSIVGETGSRVAGSLVDGQLTASILRADGAVWGVQPADAVLAGSDAADHLVYDSRHTLPRDWTCGAANMPVDPPPAPAGSFAGSSDNQVCQIACDADTQFYNSNGSSVANTEQDIENIINGCENIYEADVDIVYEITAIIVRTSEPDPYSTSSAGGMLGEFQNEWNANQQSIPRDVAHLFTGKNLSGSTIGVAYLNTICNLGSAYGLSQSKFSGNFNSRVGLTAHELGHNWSANHCNGTSNCKIMCASLGGCGSLTSFGPNAINAITNKANSAACLTPEVPPDPPIITSVSPDEGGTIEVTQVTITGQNFEFLTGVEVDGTTFTIGQFWQPAANQVAFVAPSGELGPIDLRVSNIGGTSAPATFTYTANEPAVVKVGGFALTGGPFTWTYGGDQGDSAFLLVALNPSTVNIGGADILADFTILDTSVLGNAASDSLTLDPLPAAAAGLTIWSQAVMVVGGGVDDVSPVFSTFIVI